jgi:hypothetical protein
LAELAEGGGRSTRLYFLHQLFLSLTRGAVKKFLANVLEHKKRIILDLSG